MGRSAHLLVGNGAVEIKACLVDWMDLPTKSMLRHTYVDSNRFYSRVL